MKSTGHAAARVPTRVDPLHEVPERGTRACQSRLSRLGVGQSTRTVTQYDCAMNPERLWYLSSRLHANGMTPLARAIKAAIFVVFHAVLPYEIAVPKDVRFFHRGLGTVIHPNTVVGRNVIIGHDVLITAGSQEPGSPHCVTLEDDVIVGSGAMLKPKQGGSIFVRTGAVIGARTVVISDVPSGAKVFPTPSVVKPATERLKASDQPETAAP